MESEKQNELLDFIKLFLAKNEVVAIRQSVDEEYKQKKTVKSFTNEVSDISPEFAKELTQHVYSALLCLCDLSYIIAHLFKDTAGTNKDVQTKLQVEAETKLKSFPFNFKWTTIYGYTGSENQTEDATCVLSWSEDRSLIIVAFHGSISETMWEYFNKTGDWGSNFSYHPIKASEICELRDEIPEDIEFHGGFARNYASVHRELTEKIKSLIKLNAPNDNGPWILFTGHSKGGAMATIAAAAVKNLLLKCNMTSVRCGVVALSSPRAIHGDRSQAWVHETLGQSNILRINVNYDVVPLLPTDRMLQFRHVGVCKIDELTDVFERIKILYQVDLKTWGKLLDVHKWASLHYGDPFRIGDNVLRFDPEIILPLECIKAPTKTNNPLLAYYSSF